MKRSHYIRIFGALLVLAFYVLVLPRYYAHNLYSSDPDTVMSGFYHLTKRANPIAVPRAIELLKSPDDYIWLNAALYLGACKRQEAVPYLIKALRHTARGSDAETARDLHAITGLDLGADFVRWQQWWLASHPEFQFEWNSHLGPTPRLAATPMQ